VYSNDTCLVTGDANNDDKFWGHYSTRLQETDGDDDERN
jgi:hypothetical protein